MKSTASTLARSRTAWFALATVLVTVLGPRFGLTVDEVGMIVGATQALIGTFYVQDKARGRR